MVIRPHKHVTFLRMAKVLSEQATCARRNVGCILVDEHNYIVGSGYNGPAHGLIHCIDFPCAGSCHDSGQALDRCEAIHAEQNALMQCVDIHKIAITYVTASPCMHCMKMLLNTSCELIVFEQVYNDGALKLWLDSGRDFINLGDQDV